MTINAAMDVGSNSIKLLVADIAADGSYRVLHDDSEITGMAKGLKAGGQLDAGGGRGDQRHGGQDVRHWTDHAANLGTEH